jgi:hypothetical protein
VRLHETQESILGFRQFVDEKDGAKSMPSEFCGRPYRKRIYGESDGREVTVFELWGLAGPVQDESKL